MTTQTERDDFVAQLVTASLSMTQDTSNRLIDSLTEQLADSNATTDAIRGRIQALMSGPYAPTEDAILAALWPNEAQRALYRKDGDH